MSKDCGCCEGPVASTPADTSNRPGVSTLRRRVGTYGSFFETMQADLSSAQRPALTGLRTRETSDPALAMIDGWAVAADVLTFYQERYANEGYLRTATERRSVFELARLVGYVPRPGVSASVLLAYTLDPTAAPVTLPIGTKAQNTPDPGAPMQTFETAEPLNARAEWSVLTPRVGRAPVIDFADAMTREKVTFAGAGLSLRPVDRLVFLFADPAIPTHAAQVLRRIATATPNFASATTEVLLQPHPRLTIEAMVRLAELHDKLVENVRHGTVSLAEAKTMLHAFADLALGTELEDLQHAAFVALRGAHDPLRGLIQGVIDIIRELLGVEPQPVPDPPVTDPLSLIGSLNRAPVRVASSSATLIRSLADSFAETADTTPQLLVRFQPRLADTYYRAWEHLPRMTLPSPQPIEPRDRATKSLAEGMYTSLRLTSVHCLRATASLFGYNAPRTFVDTAGKLHDTPTGFAGLDTTSAISLEAVDDAVLPGSLVLLEGPELADGRTRILGLARTVAAVARDDYLLQAKSTRIELGDPATHHTLNWREGSADFGAIRTTLAHLRSEPLDLADDPITTDVAGDSIELPVLLDGLPSGRRLIVGGERTDVLAADGSSIPGINQREAAMLAGVTQDARVFGDRPHTTLKLSAGLAHSYRRDSVRVWANVVKATHGETRSEPLGSGDATAVFQSFDLKQSPLTFTAAPTAKGIAPTLEVRVNDLRWHETDTLAESVAADRIYAVHIADDTTITVTFGSGEHGARLPTGASNVRATYRTGTGQLGNVKADSIVQLASRPLGVRGVNNPLRASGGTDAETTYQARRNAPLAVAALDRLVSVRDYSDFARSFAGIGHAASTRLSDGVREVVHVTIAALDDIPIDVGSDLLQGLIAAFLQFGDPLLPVRVAPRELLALVLSANVRIDPDFLWDDVSSTVRQALLDTFAFERRDLARSAYLSEAFAAIQAVPGVVNVDIDVFDAIAESDLSDRTKLRAKIAELVTTSGAPGANQPRAIVASAPARPVPGKVAVAALLPAQIAFLVPDVRETIVLNRR